MKKLKNEYIKVSNVLDNQTCNLLFEYVKRLYQQYEKFKTFIFKADLERELREITLLKDDCGYCKGDDMLTDTLLLVLQPIIEKEIGLKLIPTYSFMRLYTKGNSLAKHTDRESCEISASLCVGSEGESSPLMIEGNPIYLGVGDLVIYRGIEVEHWREPFKGELQAQIFLHYNDINGPYGEKNLYDGRPFIGWPRRISAKEFYYENKFSESEG